MLKKLSFIWLISVLYQPVVQALPFGSFDPRSLAMGGTGVSSGTSANAGYYNPALLAATRNDENFTLEAPVLGLRIADPENLEDALDTYQASDYEGKLTTAIDNFRADQTSVANANAAAAALTNMDSGIQTLSNKPVILEANLGVSVGIPNRTVGVSIMSNARVLVGAELNYTAEDSALIQAYADEFTWVANLNAPHTSDLYLYDGSGKLQDLPSRLTSTIDVRGALIHETGLSLGTMFEIGRFPVALGITPKTVDVTTFDYAVGMQSADIDIDKGKLEYSNSNVDVGTLIYLGGGFKLGVVGKNLVRKSYTTVLGNEMVIKPQVRAGISHHSHWTTIAIDVDVTQNDPLGLDEKTQYIGAGVEINLLDTLQLRFGVKQNRLATTTSKDKNVSSIGVGFSPFGIHIDAAYAESDVEKAASLQLGFQF